MTREQCAPGDCRELAMAIIVAGLILQDHIVSSEYAARQGARQNQCRYYCADTFHDQFTSFLNDLRYLSAKQDGASGVPHSDGSGTSMIDVINICLLYTSPSPRDS